MAKVGMWLKGARGKLAGNSLSKGANGQTIIREIVTPTNPKTAAQCLQRMVFNTASQASSALQTIVDHSFEGVKYGSNSLNYFMKLNLEKLRADALRELNGDGIITANYNIKGFNYAQPNNYSVSKGSLNFSKYRWGIVNYKSCAILTGMSEVSLSILTTEQNYKKFLGYFGLEPGDQITVVALECDPNQNYTKQMNSDDENSNVTNIKSNVRIERIVFKKTAPAGPFAVVSQDNTLFAEGIIDTKRSTSVDGIFMTCTQNGQPINLAIEPSVGMEIVAMAIIRSQRSPKGKWLRSDAVMVYNNSNDAAAKHAINSYAAASSNTMQSDYTLNNALQVQSDLIDSTVPPVVQNFVASGPNVDGYDPLASTCNIVVAGSGMVNIEFESNLNPYECELETFDHGVVTFSTPTYYKENGKWYISTNIQTIEDGQVGIAIKSVGSNPVTYYTITISDN